MMNRRDALRLISAMAVSTAIPGELWALGRAVHDQLPQAAKLRTLNPHQNATVITITELIVPATETPGAKGARVNEFIDLVLSDWAEDEERQRFLKGLADLDIRSRDVIGKDFVDCPEKQQVELLTELDDQLAAERESMDHGSKRHPDPPKHFFYLMKRLTLLGYYTSEVGAEQELQYEVIPTQHGGCVPIEDEGKA